MQDCIENYDIDGVLWRTERPGPLADLLSFHHKKAKIKQPTGFDPCHLAKAKEKGIDVERVKAGFNRLEQFSENGIKGIAPIDGYYVEFWHILFEYPEILQWQQLAVDSIRNVYQEPLKNPPFGPTLRY